MIFYVAITGDFKHFLTLKQFFRETTTFFKKLRCHFLFKSTPIINAAKLLCQKPMLRHIRGTGGHAPPPSPSPTPNFLRGKKEKGRQRQKRKGFKAEAIKRLLSPRSKYYCFNHSRVSRIRKFSLSANHGGRQYFSV